MHGELLGADCQRPWQVYEQSTIDAKYTLCSRGLRHDLFCCLNPDLDSTLRACLRHARERLPVLPTFVRAIRAAGLLFFRICLRDYILYSSLL